MAATGTTATLSSLQPVVAVPFTAAPADVDALSGGSSVTWSWARSPNGVTGWTPIGWETSATYTPVADDVNHYLRATAS